MNQIEDYVKRILKVLIYIEDHIEDEMTLAEMAKVACQSPFHFHRIFQAIVGETAHRYVRRLRLERAAGRLLYTEQPVTEIAMEANYDTPSAFTRVFKECMGKSPRNYRTLYKEIIAMTQKINELPMIQPDKIVTTTDLTVLFVRRNGNYTKSPWDAWEAMLRFVIENKLDRSQLRYFGIAHDDPQVTSEDKLRYDACILALKGIQEKGEVCRQVLKGGKYAVFTHLGTYNRLEEAFARIFLKWLPLSQETVDDSRAVFCEHFNMEYVKTDETKLVTKIYIPIV